MVAAVVQARWPRCIFSMRQGSLQASPRAADGPRPQTRSLRVPSETALILKSVAWLGNGYLAKHIDDVAPRVWVKAFKWRDSWGLLKVGY